MPFVVGIPGIALCLLQLGSTPVRAPGGRFALSLPAGTEGRQAGRLVPERRAGVRPAHRVGRTDDVGLFRRLHRGGPRLRLLCQRAGDAGVVPAQASRARAGGSHCCSGLAATLVMYLDVRRAAAHPLCIPAFITPMVLRALGFRSESGRLGTVEQTADADNEGR